jgi:hypothetical protein
MAKLEFQRLDFVGCITQNALPAICYVLPMKCAFANLLLDLSSPLN